MFVQERAWKILESMKRRIHDYYVLSFRFNGKGKGIALGFDSEYAAYFVASRIFLGFAKVASDYQLESWYPEYYHNLISKTS